MMCMMLMTNFKVWRSKCCLMHSVAFLRPGCVITEMNNNTVELKDETRKPFYLWPGSSLSSLSFTSFLNATGDEEVVETFNLKNETQLLPKEWNQIEFSTTKVTRKVRLRKWFTEYSQSIIRYIRTKHIIVFFPQTNDRSFPSVSIPAINVTRILRNCSNCLLKELQIKVEGRAMLAFNCSNNTKPTSFFADHRKDAISAGEKMTREILWCHELPLRSWKECVIICDIFNY